MVSLSKRQCLIIVRVKDRGGEAEGVPEQPGIREQRGYTGVHR